MEGQKVWNNIISSFKAQVSASTFKTWFSGAFFLEKNKEETSETIVVGLRNNFVKEQVEKRFLEQILIIAKEKNPNLCVSFVVAQKEQEPKEEEPLFSGVPLSYMAPAGNSQSLNPAHNLENFVVGPSNNLAFLAASQVAENPGAVYNPLLLYGPTGVGKTHLLQAIGNKILTRTVNAKVLYVSAEKFTNDYIASLRNQTQAAFREKYRNADVLLVDDIQFLAGKEGTQDEFFYTFNELYLSGRQIVLASDRHPKEIGKVNDRLVSRFMGGMAADVGYPDVEMKMAILSAKCRQGGVELPGEIIEHVAKSSQGGARELEGCLTSVLALTRLGGGNVSLDRVKEVLENNKAGGAKPTPEKMISAVCKHFKVSADEIEGASRKASLVNARQVVMFLLRKELDLPLCEIGKLLGGRDHSTVIYGIEKVESEMKDQNKRDEILRLTSQIASN